MIITCTMSWWASSGGQVWSVIDSQADDVITAELGFIGFPSEVHHHRLQCWVWILESWYWRVYPPLTSWIVHQMGPVGVTLTNVQDALYEEPTQWQEDLGLPNRESPTTFCDWMPHASGELIVSTDYCLLLSCTQENYEVMKRAFVFRTSLVPYSYSSARTAYDEGTELDNYLQCRFNGRDSLIGLSLLRPMYYEFPESPQAYTFDKQVSVVMFDHWILFKDVVHELFCNNVYDIVIVAVFLWSRHPRCSHHYPYGWYNQAGQQDCLDS